MLVVEELYKEAVADTDRKLIIFNGELDRIRSGCILCILLSTLLARSILLWTYLASSFIRDKLIFIILCIIGI